jgi:hypothetical protein
MPVGGGNGIDPVAFDPPKGIRLGAGRRRLRTRAPTRM